MTVLDELYAAARAVLPGYKTLVEGLATEMGGANADVAPLKSEKRARMKALFKYKDADGEGVAYYRLTDLVRATLEFPTLEALFRGFQVVCERLGDAVREVNDRYTVALPGGYRDLQLVVAHEGHLCELQLNTSKMIQAKKTKGFPARASEPLSAGASRRRRGRRLDIPWSACGDAATWVVRMSRRRRGQDADSPLRRVAAAALTRRFRAHESQRRRGQDVDIFRARESRRGRGRAVEIPCTVGRGAAAATTWTFSGAAAGRSSRFDEETSAQATATSSWYERSRRRCRPATCLGCDRRSCGAGTI